MFQRKNSKDEEINTSNYCLFNDDSPKEVDNNKKKKKKKLENPKTSIYSIKKKFNPELNDFQDIDIPSNNLNINNKYINDSFYNFRLLQDTQRGNKKIFDENNNDNNNINEKIDINSDININNNNNYIKNSEAPYSNTNDDYQNNENKELYKNKNKSIFNNIININNNYNNNIININNINNQNKFNVENQSNEPKINIGFKDNNINFIEDNINNSFDEEKKNSINIINEIKTSKIKHNNISEKSNINNDSKISGNKNKNNQKNKKISAYNKDMKLDLKNDIRDKNEIGKIQQNMKLMKNKDIKLTKTFIFSDNNKNLINQKESEEEKREREEKEKERSDIRDKLKCYLCFGKINKARFCLNCQKIACENCVKNMILKHGKCLNCKKPSSLNDIILLPFMDDITNFFINIENNQNQNIHVEKDKNYIIDESDSEDNEQNININKINNKFKQKEEKNQKRCEKHKEKYIEYYCFQCGEYLCPKCLLFFNESVVLKHNNHTIVSMMDLKNYNLKEAIDEYKQLKNSKKNLDKSLTECNLRIKQLTIKKEEALKHLEETKNELEWSFMEKINLLKDLITKIEKQKEDLENSIDSVPNSFDNIINQKDFIQGKLILKELKKLNSQLIPEEELNPKKQSKKNDIYYETFESEEINLELPQYGIYMEELNIYDKEINFIIGHQSNFKIDLLGGNFIFTLSIKVGKDYYNQYHPSFKGFFMLINSENKIEWAKFIGNIYTNGVQILSVELSYDNIKKIIGENNNFKIICCVNKSYYK